MILMQINSDELSFLVGDYDVICNMPTVPALPAFSEKSVALLAALSRELLQDKRTKKNIDVMSYAYWIRKASLERIKELHIDRNYRIGRGVAFHVAPSNVPVNFAVSMTSSILAGNATIIRVSNKQFEQVDIICDALNKLLKSDFQNMRQYLCLIRYDHNDRITQELSNICDVRVIWGGNRTIDIIRQAKLPPRAIELAFADRHSVSVINADAYLELDPGSVAKGFYTDTYYTDQNACSSPRLVFWLGKKKDEARKRFWDTLEELVVRDYDIKPIQSVDKYVSLCALGMSGACVHRVSKDNYVVRVEVDTLFPELMDYKNGGGFFFEYLAQDISELTPVLTKQCQTISVLGIEKQQIMNLVLEQGVRGVDRIVPLGETMGLEFIWDGFKMVEMMSRFVYMGTYQ